MKKPIMINPRSKGKRHEYFVRDMIRAFGWQAQRSPLSGGFVGMKGDIVSPDFPLFVEAKNTQKTEFAKWYHKAETQCEGKPPVIVWTTNREQVFAFLLFNDLLMLMRNQEPVREKIGKPIKPKHLSLEETSGLKFSKANQIKKNR